MNDPAAGDGSCGIKVVASDLKSTMNAADEIAEQLAGAPWQHVLVHFSSHHDAEILATRLGRALPNTSVVGCSTSGEIGPNGMRQGSILALAFPHDRFRIRSEVIEDIDRFGVERATNVVRRLREDLACPQGQTSRENVFAHLLVDGVSNYEEMLVASINWAMGDLDIVGGSAGDNLDFRRTSLIHNGRAMTNAAILTMIETTVPFRTFKTNNFEPTTTKLVVTSADTENRIVRELNAEAAAHEYARAVGLMPDELGPFSFASYPLVVKVGEEYFCRSIRNVNPDGSLTFFCAIDEGLVFTVATAHDMLEATERTLVELDHALGGVDMVLGFDCVLRRLDAENRQIRHRMEALYQRHNIVGFHTYGEQYNAMHLNQTLTGIAFGRQRLER
ncbi:MAG: FIST N-terminal domain-containing protein [Hyphomicrobiaceae bacterium]|nr:FIST N-terminal domain-containing protein [Hyphomicrobiaceae bacterium]